MKAYQIWSTRLQFQGLIENRPLLIMGCNCNPIQIQSIMIFRYRGLGTSVLINIYDTCY